MGPNEECNNISNRESIKQFTRKETTYVRNRLARKSSAYNKEEMKIIEDMNDKNTQKDFVYKTI